MEILDYPSPDYLDTCTIPEDLFWAMEKKIELLEKFKNEVIAISNDPEDYLDDLHQILEEGKECEKELRKIEKIKN